MEDLKEFMHGDFCFLGKKKRRQGPPLNVKELEGQVENLRSTCYRSKEDDQRIVKGLLSSFEGQKRFCPIHMWFLISMGMPFLLLYSSLEEVCRA